MGTRTRGPTRMRWAILFVVVLALAGAACSDEETSTPASTAAATSTAAAPSLRNSRDRQPAATGTATGTATSMPTAAPTSMADDSSLQLDPGYSTSSTESDAVAAALIDRKVVQEAAMMLKVDNVRQRFDEIALIADGSGGFVLDSSLGTEKDYEVASMTVRVPVDRFQEVLSKVRHLAIEVINEQSSSQDVTLDYTDLSSRLGNLEAIEQRYLTLLGEAEGIKEILTVQDRLNGTRAEIEQTRGRLNVLENLTQLSTLKVNLRPEAAFAPPKQQPKPEPTVQPEKTIGETAADAWDSSVNLLKGGAKVIVAVAVFSWWLVIPTAVAALTWWRVATSRTRRARSADGGSPA